MKFCETLKEKITVWYIELLYLSITPTVVVQHIKNPAWAIKKQPVERGKRELHFRCFCIKCIKC